MRNYFSLDLSGSADVYLMFCFIFSSGSHFVQRVNGLCNIGSSHYEEHFCEIILNLGQWLRRYL